MKQSQTSTSISPSVKGTPNYPSRALIKGALKPALLAVVVAIVTAGCKTQAITPPGGVSMPMPPPSGGMPGPSGGSSGSSGESSESSGESSGDGGSSGGSSGSTGGMPTPGGGSSGSSGGSSGSSDGSSGSVGSVPQIEMPGGFPGADGGADGDGDAEGDGDSNSDCGDTGDLPGGVGGMGQAGECLGGGGSSASDSDSEAASDSSSDGGGGGGVTGTGGAGGAGQFPAESDAERAERLGRELEESVGGFDQVLMEEQREIAAVGRSTEGFGGGGSSGGSGGISLGEQSTGGSGGGSVIIANPSSPTRESPIAGMSDQEIRERTPDDIPVIVNDDIIARQLREAALAEEDPELRERLWVEYRKYRGL